MNRTKTLAALAAALLTAALGCAHRAKPAPAAQQAETAVPAPRPPLTEPAQPPPAPSVDRAQPPALGPNPPLVLPAQRHFTLSNGLRVRLVEQHRLPLVALELVVDAGAARDPAGLAGLAGFTADMVTEGTKTRTATQLSDELGFLGASLDASASPDAASLGGGCLAQHLPKYLELFADVARNPSFPKADFERVQDERRVALLQAQDQPQLLARKAFTPLFWGNHPYGHLVIGDEASLARTKRADLVRFHQRLWVASNSELIVVGDVTEAELRPLLEKTLGGWSTGRAAPTIAPRGPAAPHRTLLIDKPGASQSLFALGTPGIDRRSPDFVSATVMLQVLGGGTASRLFRILREEKGYTYGIGARADARRLAGASVVGGSIEAKVTGAALKDLLLQLDRMRAEPVPGDELDEAKEGIVRSLPSDFATLGGIAGQLAVLSVYGLPDDYWSTFAKDVERVTAADVQRMADKYLAADRLTLVVVGQKALIQPQLAGVPVGKLEVEQVKNPTLPRKPAARNGVVPPPGAGTVPGTGEPAPGAVVQ